MLITPRPGTDRDNLLQALIHVHAEVVNARGASGNLIDYHRAYVKWADNAVYALRSSISAADLDRLVLTRRYWMIQPLTTDQLVQGTMQPVINTELAERTDALQAAIDALRHQITRWSRPGLFAVADTSVFIEHPNKIGDMDLRPHLGIREERVHLLLPIIVLDELDSLKRSKDEHERWRARHTLSVIDARLANPAEPGELRAEDFTPLREGGIPQGQITMEIVFDAPGHSRLPIADDEIIDAALRIQSLAGRRVKLITYDTSQSTRARAAGLDVVKIAQDPGPEPEHRRDRKNGQRKADQHRPGRPDSAAR
ncbi:PIN domain-containing protein [Nonomuraea sp. NPDC003754]